jgi:sec-independent protein translocase protein TatC
MEEEKQRTATIIEHLEELRTRLIRSLFAVAILFPASWPLSHYVLSWMRAAFIPDPSVKLYYMAPMELFMLRMKISAALGVLIAIPYIAWQVWSFVAPALYKKERKVAFSFVFSSSFLFLLGAAFALFGIFPMLMKYSFSMGGPDIQPLYSASSFIGTAALLMLAFGLSFQLPLAVVLLVRSGLVSVETVRGARAYIVVGIFVVAGVITPPDMVSMLALALPTCGLFELSLLFASWSAKRAKAAKEAEELESSGKDYDA